MLRNEVSFFFYFKKINLSNENYCYIYLTKKKPENKSKYLRPFEIINNKINIKIYNKNFKKKAGVKLQK